MRDHRVPLLGDAWRLSGRTAVDIEASRESEVQAVLAGLRELGSDAPVPDAGFRSELRAQLVAITDRVVVEGEPAAGPGVSAAADSAEPPIMPGRRTRARGATHARGGALTLPIGRIVSIAAAFVVVTALLLGGAVFASRRAVPGDTLYGVKRASERVQLATDSDSGRPHDLLRFAARRVDESITLARRNQATAVGLAVPQGAGAVNPHTQSMIRGALADFDSKVRQASRLLGQQAVSRTSAAPLRAMTSWSGGQAAKLDELSAALAGSDSAVAVSASMTLLDDATGRAQMLASTVDCGCLGAQPTDSLGPQPCSGCANPPAASGSSTKSTRTGSGQGGAASPAPGPRSTGRADRPASKSATEPTPPKVRVTVPVPGAGKSEHTAPSTPVAVDSCGVQVDIGVLKASLGSCPSS